MMRYHRVSPDCLPLSNGKKPNLRPSPSRASSKEETNSENGGGFNNNNTTCTSGTSLEAGVSKGFRFRSPSRTTTASSHHHDQTNNNNHQTISESTAAGGGDVLLQWGQRKRSRVSRAEIRSVTDDSSSSSGQGRQQQQQQQLAGNNNKVPRRGVSGSMLPPPPPPPPPQPALLCGVTAASASNGSRVGNLRNGLMGGSKESSSLFVSSRNLDDVSALANGSPSRNIGSRAVSRSAAGKRSPPPDKVDKKANGKDHKQNGFASLADHRLNRSETVEQEASGLGTNVEKANMEVIEWPRIYIALSRKEKEEDFLAMKGTKLPHRPKKRAKNIDKALQYCFPGMWLSDLNKTRYEVREKKCVKKQKRRGLKGMENMDTDSE